MMLVQGTKEFLRIIIIELVCQTQLERDFTCRVDRPVCKPQAGKPVHRCLLYPPFVMLAARRALGGDLLPMVHIHTYVDLSIKVSVCVELQIIAFTKNYFVVPLVQNNFTETREN